MLSRLPCDSMGIAKTCGPSASPAGGDERSKALLWCSALLSAPASAAGCPTCALDRLLSLLGIAWRRWRLECASLVAWDREVQAENTQASRNSGGSCAEAWCSARMSENCRTKSSPRAATSWCRPMRSSTRACVACRYWRKVNSVTPPAASTARRVSRHLARSSTASSAPTCPAPKSAPARAPPEARASRYVASSSKNSRRASSIRPAAASITPSPSFTRYSVLNRHPASCLPAISRRTSSSYAAVRASKLAVMHAFSSPSRMSVSATRAGVSAAPAGRCRRAARSRATPRSAYRLKSYRMASKILRGPLAAGSMLGRRTSSMIHSPAPDRGSLAAAFSVTARSCALMVRLYSSPSSQYITMRVA
mmetsp:Transcript_8619/g.25896  ORF Transcript_8619/g.25896 Transcript_8619/m.25896 type:complete len:365 (+) Transcript_8619:415-1509(+)